MKARNDRDREMQRRALDRLVAQGSLTQADRDREGSEVYLDTLNGHSALLAIELAECGEAIRAAFKDSRIGRWVLRRLERSEP